MFNVLFAVAGSYLIFFSPILLLMLFGAAAPEPKKEQDKPVAEIQEAFKKETVEIQRLQRVAKRESMSPEQYNSQFMPKV